MLAKIGFIVLLCLGICIGLGYDRRPEFAYRLQFLPFIHPTIRFPGGPLTVARAGETGAVAAMKAASANLGVCHGNVSTLEAASARREAAVRAMAAQSAAWVAQGRKAVQAASAEADSWHRKSLSIMAETSSNPDLCAAADLVLKDAGHD